jgi:hypothetical protein
VSDTPNNADVLARWLDQPPGTEPPADLDPDVLEGIIALRPDLAPPHRVTVEQVLARVTEGPLTDVDATAQAGAALHAWLNSPPGQPPPATLDAAVIEAATALRPDLAPPLRVTIDDVLAELSEGPLAESAPPTPISLDAARKRRVPWWAWSGIGVAAMAATTLLFVAPIAHMVDKAPSYKAAGPVTGVATRSPQSAVRVAKKAKKAGKYIKSERARKRAPAAEPPPSPSPLDTRLKKKTESTAYRAEPVLMAPADEQTPPVAQLLGIQGAGSRATGAAPSAPPAAAPAAAPPPTPATSSRSRPKRNRQSARGRAVDADDSESPPVTAELESANERIPEAVARRSDWVEIRVTPGSDTHGIELTCANGYRHRRAINQGRAIFSQVPDSECMIKFKGGEPARFHPVHPGQTLRCSTDIRPVRCTAIND